MSAAAGKAKLATKSKAPAKAPAKAATSAKAAKAAKPFKLGAVERIILYVRDFNRAVKFYGETLAIGLKYQSPGWAALATSGIEINLHEGLKGKPADKLLNLSFRVDDFDAACAELKKRGVTVGAVFQPCEGLRCAPFSDPDGHRLHIEGV
jgi:predicted enzyme related to lactoylglutathione lyase